LEKVNAYELMSGGSGVLPIYKDTATLNL